MEVIESNRYIIYCTTALAISVVLFYAYAKYKLSYWSRRGVKTPPTHFIFGNFKDLILLRKAPADLIREIYESADPDDPYIGFYIFHKPMLLLRSHDLIKQIMVRHFDVFPNRRFGSFDGSDTMDLYNLLAVTSQSVWKYLRAKLTPALTGQKLKAMMPLVRECTEPMLKYIDGLPADQNGWKTQDTLEITSCHINNVLASVIYGINVNAFETKDRGFFEAALQVFRGCTRSIVFIVYFFFPDLIPIIKPFSTWPVKYFRKCWNESIKYREEMGNKRGDLVDFLIMLKNGEQNPIFKFEGDNLLAQVMAFHIAGFESTGTASAWTIYELARKPEYQDILYEEIKNHLSGKEITMELINEMSFLDCIVNEAMRLHPPLPVTDRTAIKDFVVPETGLVIEKGVSIYVSINSTNQDPKYFDDPYKFIPLREKTENKKFYESLAFGIGPRSCIGQRLAILIMKITLITLISNYSLVCENKNMRKEVAVHLFKYAVDNFNVKLKKREQEL
ncbi:probable cytochrome P450 6g2 [Harpegnathos saltator]|uniref:Probable cytochrome P450 6g2 n=1 Tax=Harpegnathos saltator TaxID=610380 RepID=E2BPL5_HARSA|nr:probable cytochrome P450 6g2 [Harpegnathos saltator]EFN82419.1 Probable cytochrome P450 6g2 [Harpegnathos saltator]